MNNPPQSQPPKLLNTASANTPFLWGSQLCNQLSIRRGGGYWIPCSVGILQCTLFVAGMRTFVASTCRGGQQLPWPHPLLCQQCNRGLEWDDHSSLCTFIIPCHENWIALDHPLCLCHRHKDLIWFIYLFCDLHFSLSEALVEFAALFDFDRERH